jgi:hypothetical protein
MTTNARPVIGVAEIEDGNDIEKRVVGCLVMLVSCIASYRRASLRQADNCFADHI